MNIGKALATVRKAKGISQNDLAREAGLNVSSVSLFERNLREPKFVTVEKLSNALGVPTLAVVTLALEEDERKEIPYMLLSALDSWAMGILAGLTHLSEEDVDTA